MVVEVELVPRQRTTTGSRKTSQRPRVSRNRDSSPGDFRRSDRYAPVPVRRKNTGAQKCVIQRVKNSAADAVARFVGLLAGDAKVVSRVIERHHDHDDAAKHVHRLETRPDGRGR